MKSKTVGKVLVLVALSVATSFVTSALLAKDPKPKLTKQRRADSSVLQGNDVPTKVVEGKQPASRPANATGGVTAIEKMTVQVMPDSLRVAGKANIRDLRPGVNFVWSIRVLDPVKQVFVAERRYDTQVFGVPEDSFELKPTFNDEVGVSLPPGKYNVELVLYEVPRGGVALLDNPAMSDHQLMAKKTVRVIIRN